MYLKKEMFKAKDSAYLYPYDHLPECWSVKIVENLDNMCIVKFDGILVPEWAKYGCPGPLREDIYLAYTRSLKPREQETSDLEKMHLWEKKVEAWKLAQKRARDLAEFLVFKKYKKPLLYLLGSLVVSFTDFDGHHTGILQSIDNRSLMCRVLINGTVVFADMSAIRIVNKY